MSEEMLEVVDRDGVPTGEILKKSEVKSGNLFHKVVTLFIINNNNQILLEKRSANKKVNPNKLGPCEGHVSAYEDNITAMLRELNEELGVTAKKEEIIPFCTIIKERETNSNITYAYYMFMDRTDNDFIIQEEELSGVQWVDFYNYKEMVMNNDQAVTFSNKNGNVDMLNKLEIVIRNRE